MKLIFNKEQKGQVELKRVLGFIDKDVSYKNLDRFIKAATRQLYLIIGQSTYEVVQAYYLLADPTEAQKEQVEAVQDCIAIEAHRKYTPSTDVAHGNNGRRMRLDDHEKQAFQWLIDADNQNMERMYYEALDQLLALLEPLASWKATDQYKKLNALFISTTADFQEYFDINHSRLLLLKLSPGIRQCERQAILPRLGKVEFDALKEDASNKEELLSLVKEACVMWALSWAMRGRLTVTLFPDGILQRYTSDKATTQGKKPAAMNEVAWAAQEFRNDADLLLLKIEEMVAPEVLNEEDSTDAPTYDFDEDDNFISTT